jgi:hypothetical protein
VHTVRGSAAAALQLQLLSIAASVTPLPPVAPFANSATARTTGRVGTPDAAIIPDVCSNAIANAATRRRSVPGTVLVPSTHAGRQRLAMRVEI